VDEKELNGSEDDAFYAFVLEANGYNFNEWAQF
jgi:hypothetical protein